MDATARPADPHTADAEAAGHDALLLTSFGGPEGHDDVMPFLRRVVAGRGVPDERLQEVAAHYHDHGGHSPINEQNLALVRALSDELARRSVELPVLFGNRNWHPLLADTLQEAATAGHRRLLALVTSAFSSYSGCRQYREDLARARDRVLDATGVELTIDKVRVYFNHPGFVTAMADHVRDALASLGDPAARIVFVTHSIPLTMSRHSDYLAQHLEACRLVAAAAGRDEPAPGRGRDWDLVFCSRSGPPQVPWLEPDVNDHLTALHADGTTAVVVVPIGFISDHMEVVHDLDVEAAETARELGLGWARAATVGTHPAFVAGLVDLVQERVEGGAPAALGTMGPWHDACPVDCCRVPDQPHAPTVASRPATDRRG